MVTQITPDSSKIYANDASLTNVRFQQATKTDDDKSTIESLTGSKGEGYSFGATLTYPFRKVAEFFSWIVSFIWKNVCCCGCLYSKVDDKQLQSELDAFIKTVDNAENDKTADTYTAEYNKLSSTAKQAIIDEMIHDAAEAKKGSKKVKVEDYISANKAALEKEANEFIKDTSNSNRVLGFAKVALGGVNDRIEEAEKKAKETQTK